MNLNLITLVYNINKNFDHKQRHARTNKWQRSPPQIHIYIYNWYLFTFALSIISLASLTSSMLNLSLAPVTMTIWLSPLSATLICATPVVCVYKMLKDKIKGINSFHRKNFWTNSRTLNRPDNYLAEFVFSMIFLRNQIFFLCS